MTVSSRQHPFVQRCRRLAAGRGDEGEVLLEGQHLVEDALAAGLTIEGVLVDERHEALAQTLAARDVVIYRASAAAIDAASPVRSPSGVVGVARWSPSPAAALLEQPDARLVGVVGVQDPGNVGTIIRSADALAATGVLILGESAAPGGWKALRGAMGSTFRLAVGVGSTETALSTARASGIAVVASVASGGRPPDEAMFAPPVLLLIGSEGAGLSPAIVSRADRTVTLPMRDRINSLNAATSASILLWEMTRTLRTTGAAR